jgi:hypothetical protein
MELSPSGQVANHTATQELHKILRNPKIHYCVHKSPPLIPIQNQNNTVHITHHISLEIRFNIIHPPTSWSS